jgi:hypothetical protein
MSNEIDFAARRAALEAELTQSVQQEEEEAQPQYATTRQPAREQVYTHTPKGSRTDRNLLNIAGGVLVLFAAIDIVLDIQYAVFGPNLGSYFTAMWAIGFAGVLFRLVCGVLGVIYCDEPKRARVCFVLGIILFLPGAWSLYNSLGSGVLEIVFGVTALVLPGVYIAGAVKTMKGDI